MSRYPFDTQVLSLALEDADRGADEMLYVFDEFSMRPTIVLPGYRIGDATMVIESYPYDTAFGDRAEAYVRNYSRTRVAITIERPWLSGATKALLPIVLIILCAAASLPMEPRHVGARIGLAITSLLALVAQQFTMLSLLPEVGYLTLLDQLFVLSYAFVVFVVATIVREQYLADHNVSHLGSRLWLTVLATVGYLLVAATLIWANLSFDLG